MKKIMLVVAAIFCAYNSFACTNLLIGKAASADGSTMITYSADSYSLYGELYHWPAQIHAADEMLKVYEWDTGKYLGEIEQVAQTYNVVGNINEYQVSIGETTFDGRPELNAQEGVIDYGSLMYIALQRSKTAREAIGVMTGLVDEYGYYSTGESFSVADPNEAWVLEMIGKGKGRKGAVWVAVRIPDDCISAHANQARIQQFPLNDKQNCLYSEDVISFAREMGYFSGKDKDFSFAQAYNPINFGGQRYCEARVWSFFNRFNKDMAHFVSYAKGETQHPMPLYIKPDRKLSFSDVKEMMRDHYEGTELDFRYDAGAGAFESAYRLGVLEWEVDSVMYCNERPIATQQTGFTFVSQMRSWLPNEVGGVLWFGTDDAAHTVYVPMYCSITQIPECFRVGNGDLYTYSETSSFWINNRVANMVYGRYDYLHKEVQKVQQEIENRFIDRQDGIERIALEVKGMRIDQVLTDYSNKQARYAFDRWKKLSEFLMIKYMDGAIREEKDGEFVRNEYGLPLYPKRVSYSEKFYRGIVKDTGDKYKVK